MINVCVMVAFKGTTAGSLKQYIQNKPDKFGFKLFCRASSDGFIHDILMYQGAVILLYLLSRAWIKQSLKSFMQTIFLVVSL